jgi:hypothetical protein
MLAAALLAIWQVPGWLDWTRYRSTIEVLASATLRQPVTIQGPISLTLLPQPVLTAARVNVGNDDPTGGSIKVDALRLRVALWPLLGGRIDARELVLRGPDLRIPWPAGSGMLLARPPSWLAAFAARIEGGRLTIGRLALTGIDATLATLETGALSAVGTAKFGGEDWHFTARLTAAGADGVAGLNVTLDGHGKAIGLGASFTGRLAADGTIAGTIASRGPNLAVLLPAPPVPFRADGRLTVNSGLALADDLSLEIGGSPASGAVALRVVPQQRLDIALAASRLDLDAWLPMLLRAGTTIVGINVPTGIDLSAEAAPYAGGTLQHLRAAFDLTADKLVMRDASVVLPGDAMLHVSGDIARSDPAHPRFEGTASLRAPVFRTTLRWFREAWPGLLPSGLVADLPAGTLERVQLSADVSASADGVALRGLVGSVNNTPIIGTLGFKRGEPPAVTADLTLDRLALDPWWPAGLPSMVGLAQLATGLDAELRIRIPEATIGTSIVRGAMIDAAFDAGSLKLRRMKGSIDGVHLEASGSIADTGRLTAGSLRLSTDDATPLGRLLPPSWHATPALWHGSATLAVEADGPPEALALGIRLTMADATLESRPVIDTRSGEWTGPVTLRHPGARRLFATLGVPEQLGLAGLPDWLGDGSLSLVAHLAGAPGRLAANSFDITAASLHAFGKLTLDQANAQPHVAGQVNLDALPLLLPSGYSEVPLPLALLRGWQADVRVAVGRMPGNSGPVLRDVSAVVMLAGGVLHIDQFAGKLGGGTLTGSGSFDGSAEPPALLIQAALLGAEATEPLDEMPLDLLSGHADGRIELTASGYSPSAVVATLAGNASLTVTDGALTGFDLLRVKQAAAKPDHGAAAAATRDALMSGTTGFDRLDLNSRLAHGDLSFDGTHMTCGAGEVDVSGGIGLTSGMLDLRITLRPAVPNPPDIVLRLTGPADHANRLPELARLSQWLADRAP